MQNRQGQSGHERRLYPRESASGLVTFRVFPMGRSELSLLEDRFPKLQANKDAYDNADLMDISSGGMRIKTFVPLEKGFILEIRKPEEQVAMVRWVEKANDHYCAGLMYT